MKHYKLIMTFDIPQDSEEFKEFKDSVNSGMMERELMDKRDSNTKGLRTIQNVKAKLMQIK